MPPFSNFGSDSPLISTCIGIAYFWVFAVVGASHSPSHADNHVSDELSLFRVSAEVRPECDPDSLHDLLFRTLATKSATSIHRLMPFSMQSHPLSRAAVSYFLSCKLLPLTSAPPGCHRAHPYARSLAFIESFAVRIPGAIGWYSSCAFHL